MRRVREHRSEGRIHSRGLGHTLTNEVIPDAVIFDAIRDRLEHSALTVNITGDTYRGVKARKLASKKKDA